MRQGQFMVFSQGRSKEQFDIIDSKDYRLRVNKTWVEATGVWHIKFTSLGVLEHSWECFLTQEQLQSLKEIL
jgi:hypothetical protein